MSTLVTEVDLDVSAQRLWKALEDSPTLLPKIAPQLFSSITLDGPAGQVGTVRTIKLGSVAPEGSYAKEKALAIDHDNFSVESEEIEGGHLKQGFTKWSTTTKLTPGDDKSSKVTVTHKYEGSNDSVLTTTKEGLVKFYKGVAAYINSSGAYA